MPRPKKTKEKNADIKYERSRRYSRLRGMKDVLFEEYQYWDLLIKKANDLAATYGFKKIDTPIMEAAELFERSSGRSSDIVTKEMYTFIDKK